MAITPKLLRRGLEVFSIISVIGFAALLFYGNNLQVFLDTMGSLKWGWVFLGVVLASFDWFGGGLRVWVLARHLVPGASLKGSILAGGLSAWASVLTPSQTGGGPLMIYTLKRYGVPLPEGIIIALMTFVATIIFYAIAGPLALFLGAGRSLEGHGILGQSVTLYDLFALALAGFLIVGIIVLLLIIFPGVAARIAKRLVGWFESRGNEPLARRVEKIELGVERSHECLTRFFNNWGGWGALGLAVLLSAFAFANRLLAGFLVLRMLNIQEHFIDVLLLQTLITFLLYFAPTPGGSGIAEVLSAAVMSIYVPRELTPSYILLWRLIVSYLTVIVGSIVFWKLLKGAEQKLELFEEDPSETASETS